MDYLFSVLTSVGVIILVVLLFNFMIVVHELGHFFAARWRGLHVDRFQIWFGKPIWKKTINGVQWGLGWIPAGGFVSLPQLGSMEMIEGQAKLPETSKPITPIDKIIVVAAGPFASLSLAFFFACLVWMVGKPDVEMFDTTIGYIAPNSPAAQAGLLPGDMILAIDGHQVDRWAGDMIGIKELIVLGEHDTLDFLIQRPHVASPIHITCGYNIPETKWWQRSAVREVGLAPVMPAIVGQVYQGSPAEHAGLKEGDTITGIAGAKIWSAAQLQDIAKSGAPMVISVLHVDGKTSTLTMTPHIPANWIGLEGAAPLIGIAWDSERMFKRITLNPTPWEQVGQSLKWMKSTIEKVIAPKSSVGVEHLSGPVGILTYFYKLFIMNDGWKLVFWFAVVLNVNLAVLNMLPLPIVDGGHIVINAFELIFRRPMNVRFLEFVQGIFMCVLLLFFLFVTFKDVGDNFKSKEASLPKPTFVNN